MLNLDFFLSDILFPVLDIARLAVRDQTVCSKLADIDFLNLIIENIGQAPANQLMAIRCIANMMNHNLGRSAVEQRLPEIISKITSTKRGSSNLQIAIATFYLNITITQLKLAEQNVCHLMTSGILEFLAWSTDLEAWYRAYQALGNLTCTPFGQITSAQIISVDSVVERIRDNMSAVQSNGFEKLNDIARDLIGAL